MSRTETRYDVFKNIPPFATMVNGGFQTLAEAKAELLDLQFQARSAGNVVPKYWIRKVETTDYSAEDLGL